MSDTTDAVNDQVVAQEPTATDSAPVETKAPEVADSFDEVWSDKPSSETADEQKAEPEAEATDEPTGDAEAEPETDTTDQPLGEEKPLAPKSQNRFQALANENRQLKEQNAQLLSQYYGVQTPEELVEQGESETMAEIKSLRQEREFEKYTAQVTEGQQYVDTESSRVLNDFPMFNPENDKFNSELAERAATILEPSLIRDPNIPEVDPRTGQPTGRGMVIGSQISPYQLYETLAKAAESSKVEGQIQGQKATEQMLANADNVGNAAPPKAKTDPILDVWND